MKILSVRCANCGGDAHIDSVQRVGFCSYCGSQLILDNEEKKIILSGHVSIDGMPTLENWLQNVAAFKKLGQLSKASDLLSKIRHEYPGDYRAWWIDAEDYFSQPYNIRENTYGENNTLHFSRSGYDNINTRINAPMGYIKNALIVASPEIRNELGREAANWIESFLQYFEVSRKKLITYYEYIRKYEIACNSSEIKYQKDKKNYSKHKMRRSLLLSSLIIISLIAAIIMSTKSSVLLIVSLICLITISLVFFALSRSANWKKLAEHSWSWYRTNELGLSLPITEKQYFGLFEGEKTERFRNDEYIKDTYFRFVKISDIDSRIAELQEIIRKLSDN